MKNFKEFIKESENLTEQGFVSQQVSRARALPYGAEDDTFRHMPRGFGGQFVGGLTGEIGAKDLITHQFSKKIPEQVKDQIMFLNQARQAIDRTVQSYKSMVEAGVPEHLMFVEKVAGRTKFGNYYIPYKLPQGAEIVFDPSIPGGSGRIGRSRHGDEQRMDAENAGRNSVMLFGLNQFLWNPKTRNVSAIQDKIFIPIEGKEHKLVALKPEIFEKLEHRMMFYVDIDEFNKVASGLSEKLESLETKQRVVQSALKGVTGLGKKLYGQMSQSGGYKPANF